MVKVKQVFTSKNPKTTCILREYLKDLTRGRDVPLILPLRRLYQPLNADCWWGFHWPPDFNGLTSVTQGNILVAYIALHLVVNRHKSITKRLKWTKMSTDFLVDLNANLYTKLPLHSQRTLIWDIHLWPNFLLYMFIPRMHLESERWMALLGHRASVNRKCMLSGESWRDFGYADTNASWNAIFPL